ncbi:gliding motility-associated C-terminal domain-containing protein [Mucilaginibacter sp. dw_454]|uniref:T9SS type B sorting domain-containing protein n=1 Tax=Mucilaginibacter sp. dw_454 TaxID=2720079 RepID=UPI001BD4954C
MFKPLLLILLLLSARAFAQLPPNVGFEDGSFNGWICEDGTVDANGELHLSSHGPIRTRHTLFSKANDSGKLDRYGGFPVLCPNGSNYSMRLGNDSVNAQCEAISFTFKVPDSANLVPYVVTFNYAVVLQNPNHMSFQQPRFVAHIFDEQDKVYIPCPAFDFIAADTLPGFKLSKVPAANSRSAGTDSATIYYKDWSAVTINLHGYAGKFMTLQFTTQDCVEGGHFGYAYLDIDEGLSTGPITGNTYCDSTQPVVLQGPRGFADYQWLTGDLSKSLGSGPLLSIYPPPPDNTQYAVRIIPFPGQGCDDILYTTVNQIHDGLTLKTVDTLYGCPETGVDLTPQAVTAGSSPGFTLNYFTEISEKTHVRDSTKVVLPGNYYIRGTTPNGCPHTAQVYVKLTAPVLNTTDPAPARYPATVDLTSTFAAQHNNTYTYFKDPDATIPLNNYTKISQSGSYYIKAISDMGCEIVKGVNVQVLPPLPYVVTAPNVFTPNNDGVNDVFSLHIEGFVQFNSLNIYNRYGQLMHLSKSKADLWDGNFNGKPLPAGTYYWLFDGLDTYYNQKITKSGSISIIR